MITDFLLENAALVPVALALVAAACVAVGVLVLRAGRVRVLAGLAAVCALAVVALTLVPEPGGRAFERCVVQFSVPTLGSVELLANVALLFPLAFFVALLTRRPLPAFLGASALSAVIEAVQAFVTAIGRACDTNDWAMNSAGALVAVLLAAVTLRVAGRAPAR